MQDALGIAAAGEAQSGSQQSLGRRPAFVFLGSGLRCAPMRNRSSVANG